jgi:hypothetical protein
MGPVRNVEDLMAVGHGYQRAMTLFAALKLGVFRGLASGECDASALARRVGADPGKLSILLDALAVQGLVGKKGKRYRNAQVARDLLLPGPHSMESILLHHLDGWGEWGRLPATIRAGHASGGADGGYQETSSGNGGERPQAGSGRGSEDPSPRGGPPPRPRGRAGYLCRRMGAGVSPRGDRHLRHAGNAPDRPEDPSGKGGGGTDPAAGGGFPQGPPWRTVRRHLDLPDPARLPETDCRKLLRRARAALARGGAVRIPARGRKTSPGPAFFSVTWWR